MSGKLFLMGTFLLTCQRKSYSQGHIVYGMVIPEFEVIAGFIEENGFYLEHYPYEL